MAHKSASIQDDSRIDELIKIAISAMKEEDRLRDVFLEGYRRALEKEHPDTSLREFLLAASRRTTARSEQLSELLVAEIENLETALHAFPAFYFLLCNDPTEACRISSFGEFLAGLRLGVEQVWEGCEELLEAVTDRLRGPSLTYYSVQQTATGRGGQLLYGALLVEYECIHREARRVCRGVTVEKRKQEVRKAFPRLRRRRKLTYPPSRKQIEPRWVANNLLAEWHGSNAHDIDRLLNKARRYTKHRPVPPDVRRYFEIMTEVRVFVEKLAHERKQRKRARPVE